METRVFLETFILSENDTKIWTSFQKKKNKIIQINEQKNINQSTTKHKL